MVRKHEVENHKQCPYCGYRTSCTYQMLTHIDIKHPEKEDKNFSCEKCNKSFTYEATLNQHNKFRCKFSDHYLKKEAKRKQAHSALVPETNKEPGFKKPNMSYAQLIAEALNNAPEQTLVLSDIYKAINTKYPYYDLETKGWQNSIRHNLTMNENFMKHSDKRGWYLNLSKDVPISHLETKQHTAS